MNWIRMHDITEWTQNDNRRAQEILPQLVGRLILESSMKIEQFNFPFGDGVQQTGYDGFLEAAGADPMIPDGLSVWEMGTNVKVYSKFQADCKKRAGEFDGVEREEVTFCFVTSRKWNARKDMGKAALEAAKQWGWKRVRIYDAGTLAEWLARAPGTAAWFCGQMGKHIEGLVSPETFWFGMQSIPNQNYSRTSFPGTDRRFCRRSRTA